MSAHSPNVVSKLVLFLQVELSLCTQDLYGTWNAGHCSATLIQVCGLFCVCRVVVSCHMRIVLKRCAGVQKYRSLQSVCYLASGGIFH